MTVSGNIYGVVLNDALEHKRLAPQFSEKPYAAAPVAPVVYMKPLSSIVTGAVGVPAATGLVASTTVAVLIARDTAKLTEHDVAACLGGMAVALDLSLPAPSYYRPAVAQRNGDNRLALGCFAAPTLPKRIGLRVDGELVHEWSLDRLVRKLEPLIVELSAFMTLRAGDVLMIGLPGDAPLVSPGQILRVEADGLPSLDVATVEEPA